ncbi:hypothetical protein [uncultured Finegoldia sp.]|jgi:hypothetical protein|uniref:hypothetical protein n=1 Tax=uncultured Finegoldia sp. TaxID=328009 RepID=UPI00280520A7|nr:hypothetical protein [uncultured Finegoldia sp.]
MGIEVMNMSEEKERTFILKEIKNEISNLVSISKLMTVILIILLSLKLLKL